MAANLLPRWGKDPKFFPSQGKDREQREMRQWLPSSYVSDLLEQEDDEDLWKVLMLLGRPCSLDAQSLQTTSVYDLLLHS